MNAIQPAPEQPNRELLDKVNAAHGWFRAKKTRPVWSRQVQRDQTVETLEGPETIEAGDCLCRGEAGELWPQSAERLQAKYDATGEVDADGWRKYTPKPDAGGVLAARIDHEFTVISQWGTLTGKRGDFLIKDDTDKTTQYPDDVWIVDAKLFGATYEAVDET